MRFATKIGLSATIIALIVGPLLGGAVFLNARSLLLERIVHEQVRIASGVVAEIDHVLLNASGEMKVIAADNYLREYFEPGEHPVRADAVADELGERAQLTGPWEAMVVFDRRGREVFSPLPHGCLALTDNPVCRLAFDRALLGELYHSDRVVCESSGQPGVIIAAPVFSRGSDKVVGVVVSQFVWTPIQNILDQVDALALVHLFNDQGEVVGQRSNDYSEANLNHYPGANPARKPLPGGAGYAVMDSSSHGEGSWLAVDSRSGGKGWTLLVEMPLDIIFAPIMALARNTALMVVGVLLLAGVLRVTLVRRFMRPLGELVRGVRMVEQGRFDQKVSVRSKDEFGELADSFNAMVDKLQSAQEELLRREKMAMLGQVAGSVGHELRNPLGVMSNAVYFLQTVHAGADETTREYLGIISDEIARSERIVDALLDAVRTPAPNPATQGVAELIGQILHQCAIPPSVTVTLHIPPSLPPLRVDGPQMQQVFRNLISNGVEAMPAGGELTIGAVENPPRGTVTLTVGDSGEGITPEVRARLFQPLFTTKARGIGLGLVVAKNLVEANGGRLEVQSEPGQGTVFAIVLPGVYPEEKAHG